MAVITAQIVAHHANWLLAKIDNADDAPVSPCPPGTVAMAGLAGSFQVTDGDAVYEITIRSVSTAHRC
jgi:hypothetical protein